MNMNTLRESFGGRPFTPREAAYVLGLDESSASATLRRLKLEGRLERVARGRYRVADPEREVHVARKRRTLRREEILRAPFRIALDGPDAVRVWTGDRYVVGVVPGQEVVHLAVEAADAKRFQAFLDARGVAHGTEEDWPRGSGVKVVLRIVPELAWVEHAGVPVLSRDAVLGLVRSHPTAYEGAEEWIEDE